MKPLHLPYAKFPPIYYSLIAGLATLVIFPWLIVKLYSKNVNWIGVAFFEVCFISVFLWLVLQHLLPALKGTTALELNETYLSYTVENKRVDWKDVKSIELYQNKVTTVLIIHVKNPIIERITIPLKWITGTNEDICEVVKEYLYSYQNTLNNKSSPTPASLA